MFTGLVQSVGRIHRFGKGLIVEGCDPFSPLQIGDSILVDGVCLTASSLKPNGFFANVSEETLERTNLGLKAEKSGIVNLEPALRIADRLGGHIVSGHVDGLGELIAIQALPNSWEIQVAWQDQSFGRYICQKASICVNGISLTVSDCINDGSTFSIAVIPHTWEVTALNTLLVGDLVNLEADIIAKYTESLLIRTTSLSKASATPPKPPISKEWLADQGWT